MSYVFSRWYPALVHEDNRHRPVLKFDSNGFYNLAWKSLSSRQRQLFNVAMPFKYYSAYPTFVLNWLRYAQNLYFKELLDAGKINQERYNYLTTTPSRAIL